MCYRCDAYLDSFAEGILSLLIQQQKNHTGRNASVKAHKNGIKKAKSYPAQSLKGVSTFVPRILCILHDFNNDSILVVYFRWTPSS